MTISSYIIVGQRAHNACDAIASLVAKIVQSPAELHYSRHRNVQVPWQLILGIVDTVRYSSGAEPAALVMLRRT